MPLLSELATSRWTNIGPPKDIQAQIWLPFHHTVHGCQIQLKAILPSDQKAPNPLSQRSIVLPQKSPDDQMLQCMTTQRAINVDHFS